MKTCGTTKAAAGFLFGIFAVSAVRAALPHAFTYAGRAYDRPDAQAVSLADDARARTARHVWVSPDGRLEVRMKEIVYKRFPVTEYRPELICRGNAATEILEDFRSFSLVRPAASATLRALRGTTDHEDDFTPVTYALAATNVALVATEGRSSAQWMPWTGLDFPEGDGVEVAVGWSGAWRADAACRDGACRFSAGMVKTHLRLLPGETLIQPSILVFRRGAETSVAEMQTLIHRFMLDEKCPRDASGKLIGPILPITAGGGNKSPEMMLDILAWAKKNDMPFDCFWVDAGWNGPPHMPDRLSNCGNMWWKFVGDWRFNPTVHPAGNLARVADAVHAAGMRMLLWAEPERCVATEPVPPVFAEHRDWILPREGERLKDKTRANVNLGNPAACAWVIETVSKLVRENKLDIYRQDFNMNTLPLWQRNDAPDRQGVTEAKYIAGLYRFWDTLRVRFPHLIIENCASGGRRLDFEAVSRSHSYCRTDYAIGHRGPSQVFNVQNATVNTLPYQPFQGSETTPAHMFDDYGFLSSVCAGSVFTPSDWDGGIVRRPFTAEETAWFKRVFTVADRVRPYFEGFFYPLSDSRADVGRRTRRKPDNPEERRWCAYQMHRPDLKAGFAAFFRRVDAPRHRFRAALKGLDPDALYETEDFDGTKKTVRGRELAAMTVTLYAPRSFRFFFYREIIRKNNTKQGNRK